MSKKLSTKYFQESKERLQKKVVIDIKFFLTKKKKKIDKVVVNVTKIFHRMKKNSIKNK